MQVKWHWSQMGFLFHFELRFDITGAINNKSYLNSSVKSNSAALFAFQWKKKSLSPFVWALRNFSFLSQLYIIYIFITCINETSEQRINKHHSSLHEGCECSYWPCFIVSDMLLCHDWSFVSTNKMYQKTASVSVFWTDTVTTCSVRSLRAYVAFWQHPTAPAFVSQTEWMLDAMGWGIPAMKRRFKIFTVARDFFFDRNVRNMDMFMA